MEKQPRYQAIAIDIAHSILMGEYKEGEKIHGRSTLAGRYNVSPETIRRAIAILQTMGVVKVSQGVGITVVSRSMAEKFLKGFDQKAEIQVYFDELKKLMEERQKIDQKMEAYLSKIINHTDRLASRWLEVSEMKVAKGSSASGKSLRQLKIRELTGLTVVAVVRHGIEQFSPDAECVLLEGDILLVVGSEQGKEKLEEILD
ncbi:MAG: GntR family transcriptional regulator [Desulfitobacterium sp.]|nr:GntR family transcriptional regulator [Desulfitobacterium sp.]